MNWVSYALLSALFAGLVAIFGKVGMREVDSTLATTARAMVMTLALLALLIGRGGLAGLREISARAWVFIVLAGAAGAASWLCYFRALQIGDASRVAPIDRLSVLVAVGFGVLFLGEKLSPGVAFGTLLIVAGSVMIARG